MTNSQWNVLLYAIQKRKCLLLLGAGASTLTKNGVTRPLTEWLALDLAEQLRLENHPLEESETNSLLYVAAEFLRYFESPATLQIKTEQFYSEQAKQPNQLLRVIAKLPFPMIINTAPDTLIEQAWADNHKEYNKTFYSLHKDRTKDEADQQIEYPTEDSPLLYNLFGSIEDSASLVLTEKDRLKFIEDIIQHNNAIPNTILRGFHEAKVLLFLGFDFEQWHLRIMPNQFFDKKMEKGAPIFVPNGGLPLSKGAMAFYQKQYKMNFLAESPLQFMEELSSRLTSYNKAAEQEERQAPVRAVFLYDQADEPWKNLLYKHLAVLKETKAIHTWDESMIDAGESVDERIKQQLSQANLIFLLISSDFLANDKLYNEQLLQAMQRSMEEKAYIIPILVRPCVWEGAVFSKAKFILPRNLIPIAAWKDMDDACRNIVLDLEKHLPNIVQNLQP